MTLNPFDGERVRKLFESPSGPGVFRPKACVSEILQAEGLAVHSPGQGAKRRRPGLTMTTPDAVRRTATVHVVPARWAGSKEVGRSLPRASPKRLALG